MRTLFLILFCGPIGWLIVLSENINPGRKTFYDPKTGRKSIPPTN